MLPSPVLIALVCLNSLGSVVHLHLPFDTLGCIHLAALRFLGSSLRVTSLRKQVALAVPFSSGF